MSEVTELLEQAEEEPRELVEELWTVAEAAAELRLSKMTVYRAIHEGQLKAFKMGRSFRVSRAQLEEYLRKAQERAADRVPAAERAGAQRK